MPRPLRADRDLVADPPSRDRPRAGGHRLTAGGCGVADETTASVPVCDHGGMTSPARLEVVAAVIEDDGFVLACRRRAAGPTAGAWEFPGGKIEPGESAEQALTREVREELGVDIEVFGLLRTDETLVGDRVIRLTCLRARLRGERPVASIDHDRLLWLRPADLPALDWAEPDLPAVAELSAPR